MNEFDRLKINQDSFDKEIANLVTILQNLIDDDKDI